ncbi:HD domain-containing protein [bacterium]|nr:HD domain-containing protein [bacterium]
MNIPELFLSAQKLHTQSPADPAHDWIHHWSVLSNALEIVGMENLDVKLEILVGACLFHDFDRGDKNHQRVAIDILKKGFNKSEFNEILKTIKEHPFGQKQTSTEAKVLYDADKLAYLNLLRHYELNVFNGVDEEGTKLHTKYKKLYEERIDSVYGTLHYGYTRIRFRDRMKALKSAIGKGYPISPAS